MTKEPTMSEGNADDEALRALAESATPGPWAYRPQELDDWGVVRAGPNGDGRALLICQARQPVGADLSKHRREGTDPYLADAAFIAAARTAVPRLLSEKAALTTELAEARATTQAMAEALRPFAAVAEFWGKQFVSAQPERVIYCGVSGGGEKGGVVVTIGDCARALTTYEASKP